MIKNLSEKPGVTKWKLFYIKQATQKSLWKCSSILTISKITGGPELQLGHIVVSSDVSFYATLEPRQPLLWLRYRVYVPRIVVWFPVGGKKLISLLQQQNLAWASHSYLFKGVRTLWPEAKRPKPDADPSSPPSALRPNTSVTPLVLPYSSYSLLTFYAHRHNFSNCWLFAIQTCKSAPVVCPSSCVSGCNNSKID
jgi:hypothetical protein